MRKVLMALALVTSIAAVVGVGATIDSRYAKSAVLSQVSERLENKIIQDRMDKLQERMWAMEDRWGEKFIVQYNRIHDSLSELLNFMTPEAREHYRRLQKEFDELEKRLEDGDD